MRLTISYNPDGLICYGKLYQGTATELTNMFAICRSALAKYRKRGWKHISADTDYIDVRYGGKQIDLEKKIHEAADLATWDCSKANDRMLYAWLGLYLGLEWLRVRFIHLRWLESVKRRDPLEQLAARILVCTPENLAKGFLKNPDLVMKYISMPGALGQRVKRTTKIKHGSPDDGYSHIFPNPKFQTMKHFD